MTTQGVSCEVCGRQRAPGTIHPRNSKLIKSMRILICNRCEEERKEPRWMVVLVAKHHGVDGTVRDYIKERRYDGAPIAGHEIV